jgi:hypothetical protein
VTVDLDLVKPYEGTVLSVASNNRSRGEFVPGYTGASPGRRGGELPSGRAKTRLFAVWIGIYDVGNSYYNGEDATDALYASSPFDV